MWQQARSWRVILFVALATATLASADLAKARIRTGTLVGTVVDARGRVVAGARVTVQRSDGRHPRARVTDSHGRFIFNRLVESPYDIRAYHRGQWSEWKHNIMVWGGKTTEVKLELSATPER